MSDSSAKQQIVDLGIDQLQPNPLQPRGKVDLVELEDLVSSIRQHGILEPIVAAHTPAGFLIVAGERRWKAARVAGLTVVPVLVKETTPRGMLEMALIENVQRVDLNPLDRAIAFQRLLDEFHLATSEISERIGKSAAYVSNTLRLLTLPDALKDGLLSGQISEGHARALAAIEDTRHMVEAYKQVLKEDASVRRTEDIARRMKSDIGQPASSGHGKAPLIISPILDRMQLRLQESFGEKSKVKITRSRAQTKVIFVFNGNTDDTQLLLNKIMRLAR